MMDRVETTFYAHLGRGCPIRVEHHPNGPLSYTSVLIGAYGEIRLLVPDASVVRELAESLVDAVAAAEQEVDGTEILADVLAEVNKA